MSAPYQHKQTGWVMIFVFGTSVIAMLGLTGFLAFELRALVALVPAAVMLLMLGFAAFFSSMTVEIKGSDIIWYFGPRLWKNTLSLSVIGAAAPIRTKWYWGYGIKYFGPNRWLYTVSGLDAVELTLKGGGWLRIGTDDAEGFLRALGEHGLQTNRQSHRADCANG